MSTSADRSANPPPSRQVVVTGIGLVTPLGAGREISWSAIQHGQSAVRWLDADDLNGELPDGESDKNWSRAHQEAVDSRTGNRFLTGAAPKTQRLGMQWVGASAPRECLSASAEPVVALALAAAREAMTQARLSSTPILSERGGCVIGTSKLGLRSFARAMRQPDDLSHELLWPNSAALAVAAEWKLRGPALCPVAACATGLVSLIRGADLIRSGECDVVLAGSSDASLVPIVLSSFQRLGVLARGFDEPASACRPFDAERSGFVIGEGAAVLVLEDRAHAASRGATVLAEFVAGGMASDPSGLTQVDPVGASLTWLIRDVLRRANVLPEDIDAINLHGTATRANDVAETRAVRAALGTAADRVACSSQKGAIGHLLGAAGSVESALTVLSLRDQILPPTINLRTPDPQCDLDYVANTARPMRLRNVLKVSLGFGGHLAVGLFRR